MFSEYRPIFGGRERGNQIQRRRSRNRRFNEDADLRRSSPLAVGDGDAYLPHDFLIGRDGARLALGAVAHFLMPTGSGGGTTFLAEQVQRPAGLIQGVHGIPETTTAKAEWLWMLS